MAAIVGGEECVKNSILEVVKCHLLVCLFQNGGLYFLVLSYKPACVITKMPVECSMFSPHLLCYLATGKYLFLTTCCGTQCPQVPAICCGVSELS